MLSYVKFIKDLVKNKRVVSFDPMDNMHHYNAIVSRLLAEKKEDLGSFMILYTIGCFNFYEGIS